MLKMFQTKIIKNEEIVYLKLAFAIFIKALFFIK